MNKDFDAWNKVKRYVLLYQIRMFSTNRFESRLTTIDDNSFKKVKEKLEQLLKLR
jgi:mRNA-degrading endonuclease toxin of MazEF toxin-antitoxin module